MERWLGGLADCEDCRKFGRNYEENLRFRPKASIYFNIYDKWKPGRVRTLFVAESPPWAEPKYFYNTDIKAGPLRKVLFDQVHIKDYEEHGLERFKAEGYFLIDTIKCRLRKQNSNPPTPVITNCARRFLLEEIHSLEPERIVLLGKTAKQGLEQFHEFEDLKRYNVKADYGKKIQTKNYTIVLYVFPITRNMNIMREQPLLEALDG